MQAVPLLLPQNATEWVLLQTLGDKNGDYLPLDTAREFYAGLFPGDEPAGMAGAAVASMNEAMRRVRGLLN